MKIIDVVLTVLRTPTFILGVIVAILVTGFLWGYKTIQILIAMTTEEQ